MTQEDKDILVKDLSARLSYGVKVYVDYIDFNKIGKLFSINNNEELILSPDTSYPFDITIEKCKPYLFPLSSMTEEQYYEMMGCSSEDCLDHMEVLKSLRECTDFTHWPLYEYRVIDWFHKNHFDYRGLIDNGLAIDATSLNVY